MDGEVKHDDKTYLWKVKKEECPDKVVRRGILVSYPAPERITPFLYDDEVDLKSKASVEHKVLNFLDSQKSLREKGKYPA